MGRPERRGFTPLGDHSSIDNSIIRRAVEAEIEALEAIYVHYSPMVAGYLRASNVADVEDVVSEVFLSVVRTIGNFSGSEDDFRAWLFTIAHRRRVDWIRRQRATEEIDLRSPTMAQLDTESDHSLTAALDRLTDAQRQVIVLRYHVDLPLAEVAKVTGKTIGTIKSLQRRGLATMRRHLESERSLELLTQTGTDR